MGGPVRHHAYACHDNKHAEDYRLRVHHHPFHTRTLSGARYPVKCQCISHLPVRSDARRPAPKTGGPWVRLAGVNRTDRLYALVEELRATAPRPRTARWLAERFEVSVRTIERDLAALQQTGVPIWASPGPNGGYGLDPAMSLPPVNFTPAEANVIAMALERAGPLPFADAAGTALRKIVAAMSDSAAAGARDLSDRLLLLDRDPDGDVPAPAEGTAGAPHRAVLEQAVLDRTVVLLDYVDRQGGITERAVEPLGFVGSDHHWYLVGWCRLREDGRSFRLDRVTGARLTDETAPERSLEAVSGKLAAHARRGPLFAVDDA
jgi:predicted DNA-binding transcriptional regulator YafY